MKTGAMKRGRQCGTAARGWISAAALALGPAVVATAADKSWDTQAGTWHSAGNWTPFGIPANADHARIGDHPAAFNADVSANSPVRAAALTITDGMRLISNSVSVIIAGPVVISGENVVGTTHYPSSLYLDAVDGTSFSATNVQLAGGGMLRLRNGSYADVTGLMQIDAASELVGFGTLTLMGNGPKALLNDGMLDPKSGGMTISQIGTGLIDLDGNSGAGVISLSTWNITTLEVAALTVNGTALFDNFNGHISMLMGAVLDMNLDEGWTAGLGSEIHAYVYDPMPAPARIRGAAFTLGGTLWVNGVSTAILDVEADTTIEETAWVRADQDALLRFKADTTVLGGEFTVANDATIEFRGPTTLNGGLFEPPGISATDGEVKFMGPTTWNGSVTFEVAASQLGNATVFEVSVIDAGVIDMDGTGNTEWNVNSKLTVNAESIEAAAGDAFDGTINIAGGFASELTINLDNPNAAWTMAGALNLTPSAIFLTRVAGSPVHVTGNINLEPGRAQIAADTTLTNDAVVNLPAPTSLLRFTGATTIQMAATFIGQGALQNSPAGKMTLADGAVLDEIGLINEGRLIVGNGPGIASVHHFTQTAAGTLAIEIGGYATGTEHDQLLVAGGTAQLAGKLDVDQIDAGDGLFLPTIGDEFTILTALDGISGTFAPHPTSCWNGQALIWTVLYGSHDVTLRLEAILAGLPGDMNCDCELDFFDIDPFILAVLDPATYEAVYPDCPILRADINGDGQMDFFDIDPFVALLLS